MSRLYRVHVSFEYVALAATAAAAEDLVDEVLRDLYTDDMTVRATMLRDAKGRYPLPEGYDGHSVAYGDDEARSLAQLINEERDATEKTGGAQ